MLIDPLDDQDEFKAFQALLDKILKSINADESLFSLTRKDDGMYVECIPCKTEIKTGALHKSLTNFKAHVGRPVHETNVMTHQDKKLRRAMDSHVSSSVDTDAVQLQDNSGDRKSQMTDKFAMIEARFPDVFQLLSCSQQIMCKYCIQKFRLFPERGDIMHNATTHIETKDHKARAQKEKKQQPISAFFSSRK